MFRCPHLTANDSCTISSALVGIPITVTPRTCTACSKTERPQALNIVTCSVAYHVAPSPTLLTTLRQLHKTTYNKPGTCLRNIFQKLGIFEGEACQCDEYATEMDLWGSDGCQQRIAEIIEHLNSQSISWFDTVKVVLGGYLSTHALVTEAIKCSRNRLECSKGHS